MTECKSEGEDGDCDSVAEFNGAIDAATESDALAVIKDEDMDDNDREEVEVEGDDDDDSGKITVGVPAEKEVDGKKIVPGLNVKAVEQL